MNQIKKAPAADMLDIVFDHRNKSYGAYQLRRDYPANLGRALTLGMLLIALLFSLPDLLSVVSKAFPGRKAIEGPTVVIGGTPPEMPKAATPPPPVPQTPPPPTRSVQQFVPPIVKDDDLVPEQTPAHTIEDLERSTDEIGTADVAGSPDALPGTTQDAPDKAGGMIETPYTPPEKVYEGFDVQRMPEFPGGEKELLKYVAENTRYPALARENNIAGPVVLSFVVNTDGSISDIHVLRDLGGGCTKEAIRVVEGMPHWRPGEAAGQPVKVRFILPIRFELK